MNDIKNYLTPALKKILEGKNLEKIDIGCTEALVYFIKNCIDNVNAYLKVNPKNSLEKLKHEVDIMNWLNGKIPVPKVLHYDENEHYEFLLMTEIKGFPSFSEELSDKSKTMTDLAKGLKLIHSLDISDCPFNEKIIKKCSVIEKQIEAGNIDIDDFDDENKGKKLEELFDRIKELRENMQEDLVFTHGDYCMPNILLTSNGLSGFIDLGRAGISDRYQDIALAIRSIKYNGFSQDHIDLFLSEYGITELDNRKVELYKLIDEFY
ncbi:MAG: aminoglycoside 3'-phosphotransferase [Candidatus Delongbacteria bacterium]|nr:aminoglycoside 3'-phosphotransferase [Candidatus Delongbacteria bacterium]MBN2835462.1 aminoglycoside 3'-phosphotransferase [Candidatus Delongbacteria bacterium]